MANKGASGCPAASLCSGNGWRRAELAWSYHESVLNRGYKGRIIQATEAVVRVELEAQCKTVNVKRNQARSLVVHSQVVGFKVHFVSSRGPG